MANSFEISFKSGLKDIQNNLKAVKASIGKDLTKSVMEGLGAQGRQGAISGLYIDVDKPRPNSIKAIQYTRYDTKTKKVTVGFNVGNRANSKRKGKINSAYSHIVYGATRRYSSIGKRLIVPVAREAMTADGNLSKKYRARIRKARGKVSKGRNIYFDQMKGGTAVFEGYHRGRGKGRYESGRRLIAWMPDSVKWSKSYDFHGHVQRQIARSAGSVMRDELQSYIKNKQNKIIRQGELVK